ncbi:UDP pyrophosphate phosphatase [Paraburkholderia sp. D15]|nr:UDP pyrophosphate phosphatase [Paraburkholderia sp. D15]WGS48850.1 UDP pyrophosphate phosphatase [Paraburkholderia sp. D15]
MIFHPDESASGGVMDLAMAMGVALFGMFAASTVYFFYKLER